MNENGSITTQLLHNNQPSEAQEAISYFSGHEDLNKQNTSTLILAGSDCTIKNLKRLLSNPRDELQRFRECLFWMGLDQSTSVRILFSYVIFALLVFGVPILNMEFLVCPDCDEKNQHPFDRRVLYSESALATVSFLCLSYLLRHHGLRRVLLLDNIVKECKQVQQSYKAMVNRSFRLLAVIVLPTLTVEVAHKICWFTHIFINLPLVPNNVPNKVIMCCAMVISWLYKTTVFLLMCVLFRLMCFLQILRLQNYDKLLEEGDPSVLLAAHMRIQRKLDAISRRCRLFILASLVTITLSQLSSLFLILSSPKHADFSRAGGLAVCSAVQLTGFILCLSGAAKITHKAQRIASKVSQWHAVETCCSSGISDNKHLLSTKPPFISTINPAHPLLQARDPEQDLEACLEKVSVQKAPTKDDSTTYCRRQSLVTYLQNNCAGISIYGFVLDRGLLCTIFGLELSFVLWIMGKTIGIH